MKTVPIKGYEHRYLISENGDVTSIGYGLIMKTKMLGGYPKLNLYKGNGYKSFYIHRLVAEHFIENLNNLPFVNHINGDTTDFSISNLEWVTASENVKDGFNRGRVHPQQGKRYVNRKKVCEMCKKVFEYVKPQQRFCGKKCAGINNLQIRGVTLALKEAGEL